MKKITILGVVAGLLPAVVLAAYVGAGNSASSPAPQGGAQAAVQNVYLVGGTVNISNPVAGDVLTAGGTIVISGKVDRDIMAVGGNIIIVGGSAEDVRVAGGNITIGGKVSGEIMAAGGQITITPDTSIVRDSYIAGGALAFAGTENGNLTLYGRQVRVDGTVNGNLTIGRADKVTFGSQAVVKGKVEYSAPEEAVVESGAQLASTPVFHKIQIASKNQPQQLFAAFFGILFILKTIAVLAAAYLLWYLRRRDMTAAIESAHGHFWSTLLRGFAVLVLIPVAAIILLFTVIGWIPAAVMLAAYGALLVLASPVAAIVATSLTMALFKKSRTDLKWYHILLGLVILRLIVIIPFVGWLAGFVIYLISLGATAGILKTKFSA
jgi:hypothetical protein